MRRVILLSVSILLICLAYAFAEVPCKINYQGRLIKDNVPVDGTKTMRFSIYDSAVGPTQLWTSGDVNVEVHNGLFRYVLDLSSIDWAAGQTLYLEVQVETDILTPREELYAYPYAINSHLLEGKTTDYFLNASAETQKKDGGLNIMGNVGIGTTSPGVKLHVAGPGENGIIQLTSTDAGGGDWQIFSRGTADRLEFQEVGVDTRMTIQAGGNVGIGTTSPGAKLHIGGTPGTDGIMFPDGTLQTTAAGQSAQVVGTTDINAPTTWSDMADMVVNMSTKGGNVLLMFSGNIRASGNENVVGELRFNVDGTPRHHMLTEAGDGAWQNDFAMQWLETSVSPGQHTFKVQWKGTNSNVKQNGATYPSVFTVIEF